MAFDLAKISRWDLESPEIVNPLAKPTILPSTLLCFDPDVWTPEHEKNKEDGLEDMYQKKSTPGGGQLSGLF